MFSTNTTSVTNEAGTSNPSRSHAFTRSIYLLLLPLCYIKEPKCGIETAFLSRTPPVCLGVLDQGQEGVRIMHQCALCNPKYGICTSFRMAGSRASFLSCFAAITKELNLFRKCTYIVFIPQCKKIQNNIQIV
jgi:hypothetical protein